MGYNETSNNELHQPGTPWSFVIYKNNSINYFRILKHVFGNKSFYWAEEVHFDTEK